MANHRVYTNLRMLRGVTYSEADVGKFLKPSVTLFGDGSDDSATLGEAEQEMLTLVNASQRNGQRTTMLSLVNRFERKPYGWYLAAIQCILAKLCATGKVEARRDSAILEGDALERALRNTKQYANLILEPQVDIPAFKVRRLRDFYADFFHEPPHANEAGVLAQETAAHFSKLAEELTKLRARATEYSFLIALDAPLARIQAVTGKPYTFYFDEFPRYEEALFDGKERVIDPLRSFMGGEQREIYDEVQNFLKGQDANLAYVDSSDVNALRELLAEAGNGRSMNPAKALLGELQVKVKEQIEQERAIYLGKVAERWQRLEETAEYDSVSADQRAVLRQPFDDLRKSIEGQTMIPVMTAALQRFDNGDYVTWQRKMVEWAEGDRTICDPPADYVTKSELQIPFDKLMLSSEEDVDAYLAAWRAVLMEQIGDNKRVQI